MLLDPSPELPPPEEEPREMSCRSRPPPFVSPAVPSSLSTGLFTKFADRGGSFSAPEAGRRPCRLTSMLQPQRHLLLGWALLLCTGGCSGSGSVDNAIVQAVSVENAKVKAKKELEAKAAESAKTKHAAKLAAQATIEAAVASAAVQPEQAPATLQEACEHVVAAYDEYMKAGSEKDALLWSDGRRRKLGERRVACIKVGSVAVAACEAHALSAAPEALAELPRKDAARLLMERCNDEFGEL